MSRKVLRTRLREKKGAITRTVVGWLVQLTLRKATRTRCRSCRYEEEVRGHRTGGEWRSPEVVVVLVHAALAVQAVEIAEVLLVGGLVALKDHAGVMALSPLPSARRLPVPWKTTFTASPVREKAANLLWLMLSGSSVIHERLHCRAKSRPSSEGFGQFRVRRVHRHRSSPSPVTAVEHHLTDTPRL